MDEELRYLREDLLEIGCSEEEISDAERLLRAGSDEAFIKQMRKYRCSLMNDEMHKCGRNIDKIDLLIRRSLLLSKKCRKG